MPPILSRFPPKPLSASAANNVRKFFSPLEKVDENTTTAAPDATPNLESVAKHYLPEFGEI